MKVHYDEGVATHIDALVMRSCPRGPRPGLDPGVDRGAHRPAIEPRKRVIPGADSVKRAEGNTDGRANRKRPDGPAWSKNLACAEAPCAGTGRSHG